MTQDEAQAYYDAAFQLLSEVLGVGVMSCCAPISFELISTSSAIAVVW